MQLRVAGVRLLAAFLCATWALPLAATPRFEFAPWWDHDNEDFLLQAAIVVGDVTGDGRDDVVVTAERQAVTSSIDSTLLAESPSLRAYQPTPPPSE